MQTDNRGVIKMEKSKVFYKIYRWATEHSDIAKVIATRATDKTIWFMRNNHEQRELLSSTYYQYCTSEDHAKAIIDSRNEEKAKKDAQKRISEAAPALLEALEKAREDINWMLSSRQFLNADQFNYIDAAIAAARGTV